MFPDRSRANNFDSIRLIFAVLVIFSHSFPLATGSYEHEPLWVLTRGQIEIGKVSVWGFFAISGFLIAQSWIRSPSIIAFLKRRIGRIYPGFIVVALISAIVIVPYASDAHTFGQFSLRHFVLHTLRLNIWEMPPVFTKNAHPGVLNGSLWSIPFEFWCYLGVLALGLTHLLQRRYLILAVFACVIGLRLVVDITDWSYSGGMLGGIFGDPVTWVTVLPFFMAGMVFHLFGGHTLLSPSKMLIAGFILLASFFIPHAYTVTMPTCGVYALMYLAYLPALHPLKLGRYGDFSYGVYLYAFPVQQLLVMSAGGHMSPYLLFALASPISLILGALSWFLIERHFLFQGAGKKSRNGAPRASLENLAS
jgi:peptidoglycan/LPS O-acetylase OafA/YrhL